MKDSGGTILSSVGLILAPTHRSRAYVQALAHVGMAPAHCFLVPGEEPDGRVFGSCKPFHLHASEDPFVFSPNKPAHVTVTEQGWSCEVLPSNDINDFRNHGALANAALDTLVYSGVPRALLSSETLGLHSHFLHVHGGYLPVYRGATGFYFGLLVEGRLGNTAIWIDKGVDTGPILARQWYDPRCDSDVDRVADPVTRADLLVQVLSHFLKNGKFPRIDADREYDHFYVIHPVLKHLALRRVVGANANRSE